MSLEFAEVAVTLPVASRYTYRVPDHMRVRARVGSRVLVRFGTRKVTGVVVREHSAPPEGITPLDISDMLDDEPALPGDLVELCLWASEYYEAPPGEVLRAALPVGTDIAARGVVALTEAGRANAQGQGSALPAKQRAVLARLLDGDLPVAGLGKLKPVVAALALAGYVETYEHRDRARVRLKHERVVRLAVPLAEARTEVARAPKRYAVIDALASGEDITLDELETQVPGAKVAVRELAKQNLVVVSDREVSPEAVVIGESMHVSPPPILTDEQTVAVAAIVAALRGEPSSPGDEASDARPAAPGETATASDGEAAAVRGTASAGVDVAASTAGEPNPQIVLKNVVTRVEKFTPFLLHGVTGSGKTEVYLRVIAEALEMGKTALVLVPEISLTPQLAARFRARFGDQVAIMHSGMSDRDRLGEWSRLRRGEARIAVGARSAIFAPLANLGVIVVDEEHDGSFKQDEGVRYHARDVALVRAQRSGAVCVLGSATPSLESASHAERGQFRKLVLTVRPTARPMPSVEIIDLRTYLPDGEAMLSAPLRTAIGETLAAGDQIILFLNRRGYATFTLCRACGHSFRCVHCSVTLTYHRHTDRLTCHYCNYTERVPSTCTKCGAGAIERKGLGTEKVAAAIAEAFPAARIARLDRDVAVSGARVEATLSRVARREVDVLVGTQMVTKGHDFPGVTLVGVLCADTGLNIPDFRASERTFQLLAQVAGRAGRGDRPGRVLIQTYRPHAHAVVAAANHDYASFYTAEIAAREELGYPPHGRLIAVRIDGPNANDVAATALKVAQLAELVARREGGSVDVRGPVPAPLERLRTRTRWQVWLRSADRHALRRVARAVLTVEAASSVRVGLDVDPVSAL